MKKSIINIILILLCISLVDPSICYAKDKISVNDMPDKTIIIGTYAVYLDTMTEEILEKAQRSAELNQQTRIYFKSDINSGIWYDVTNATDITGISTDGTIVTNQAIDALNLNFYTQ